MPCHDRLPLVRWPAGFFLLTSDMACLSRRGVVCGERAPASCSPPPVMHGQDGAPSLVILSPDGSRHLAGAERLSVEVQPAQPVAGVEFFVDGRRVARD